MHQKILGNQNGNATLSFAATFSSLSRRSRTFVAATAALYANLVRFLRVSDSSLRSISSLRLACSLNEDRRHLRDVSVAAEKINGVTTGGGQLGGIPVEGVYDSRIAWAFAPPKPKLSNKDLC